MRCTGITRRVVVCTFLPLALAASGLGWAAAAPGMPQFDSAITLTQPPGLSIDAALKGRSEILSAGSAEQRLPQSRVRLGLAVLVGLSLLLAAASVTLRRPSPALRSMLRRRRSVALRAPPALRLS
ncbi:MAG TPA: hypothetical protein VG078_11125 [Acidimicrobiales bacterium]|nr:hypothetical protein [Acidimicrobiales bacterium]